jgi:tetratricopeptide (TPR) repeat protein
MHYSLPKFGPTSGSGKGNNTIINNYNGIQSLDHSYPFLGSTETEYETRVGGYNYIYNNTNYNVHATDHSSVEAEYNWWGASPPPTAKFYEDGTSGIDYEPYLTSMGKISVLASESSMLQKSNNDFSSQPSSVQITISKASGNNITGNVSNNVTIPDHITLEDLWIWAENLWYFNMPEDAIGILKELIKRFPETPEANHALVIIADLCQSIRLNNLSEYLNSLVNDKKIDTELQVIALDLLVGAYLEEEQVNQAIETAEQIIDEFPDSEREFYSLYNLFLIYLNDIKDSTQVTATLEILKQKYPNEELTYMARMKMGENVDLSNLERIKAEEFVQITEEVPEEYHLNTNCPNPFNPATEISYQLPEDSFVELKIYDILGREIITLVQGDHSAGLKRVQWNGRDEYGVPASSGMYIYNIHARSLKSDKEFHKAHKMMLFK